MILAHGATITVSPAEVYISHTPLHAALYGPGARIPLAHVTGITVVAEPTDTECGRVLLDGANVHVTFSPNHQQHQQHFLNALASAQQGDAPPVIPAFDFVALDVETANEDWGSICQVGVVRVTDGNVHESRSWLCQPPAGIHHFDQFNIDIHGITADDVATAPSFGELLPEITKFIGELPVLAHNAQFDISALQRACTASGIDAPELHFGCTLSLARHSSIHFPGHRLPVVAETLGVPQNHHHDAEDDALTCAGIAIELAKRGGFQGGVADFFTQQGFTTGRLHDGRVYPVLRTISAAAAKPKAKPRNRGAAWSKAATPEVIPTPNTDADPSGVLYGQNVTLSGDFEPYDKGMLWERMAELGATIGKNVTKKTTVLVCGPWATVTSKQKRAEELISKGQDIQIWTAEQLYTALGLDEQPPF